MAVQQTLDESTLDYHKDDAKRKYPDEEPDTALQKHVNDECIEGIFFLDESGERRVWGPAIVYCHYTGYTKRYIDKTDSAGRIYLTRAYQPLLAEIDRPKPHKVRQLLVHPSEAGWNHPRGHPRHFLSFPPEVRNLIFAMALQVPPPAAVVPDVIFCNWKRNWAPIGHTIRWGESAEEETTKPRFTTVTERIDTNGNFKELRFVKRRAIDASFLRSCSTIYKDGLGLLYNNTFYFPMMDPRFDASPPSMLSTRSSKVYRPSARKPTLEDEWPKMVQKVINQIRGQGHLFSLPGWAYYDHFLRFLFTIGPANAALLKKIEFSGVVRLHTCGEDTCHRLCPDDIVHSLYFYIPVIMALCPSLEQLILYAEEDDLANLQAISNGDTETETSGATPTERALMPLLKNELRQISSLTKLDVFRSNENKDPYEWALPAMHWFAERTRKRRLNLPSCTGVEEQRLELTESLRCAFCGEGHTWNNCYNLCPFCGQYGHSRKSCPNPPWRMAKKKAKKEKKANKAREQQV